MSNEVLALVPDENTAEFTIKEAVSSRLQRFGQRVHQLATLYQRSVVAGFRAEHGLATKSDTDETVVEEQPTTTINKALVRPGEALWQRESAADTSLEDMRDALYALNFSSPTIIGDIEELLGFAHVASRSNPDSQAWKAYVTTLSQMYEEKPFNKVE